MVELEGEAGIPKLLRPLWVFQVETLWAGIRAMVEFLMTTYQNKMIGKVLGSYCHHSWGGVGGREHASHDFSLEPITRGAVGRG